MFKLLMTSHLHAPKLQLTSAFVSPALANRAAIAFLFGQVALPV